MGDFTIKERQKKWRKRQKDKGKKTITVTINEEIILNLNKTRKITGETFNEIIERALKFFIDSN